MGQQFTIEDVLQKDILELMGAKDLPEEEKTALYQKMMAVIKERVAVRVGEVLEDKDLEEFKRLLDVKDTQGAEEFLLSRGLDTAELMLEEATAFKLEMVKLQQESAAPESQE